MNGFIDIGDAAGDIIAMAIENFIYEGNREGLELIRLFRSPAGETLPINKMISLVLTETGRLLPASTKENAA